MSSNYFVITKKILLVRHGRTDWNDAHKFQGHTDIPLNEVGLSQAEKTAARLARWPIDAVYVSPLTRAHQTAEAIAVRHGKNLIVMDDLTEIDFGSWEGVSVRERVEQKDESMLKWRGDPFFCLPPGAERWDSVRQRAGRVLDAVLKSSYANIVIVCHGGIMKGLLAVALGFDPHTVWKIRASNCSITGIEVKEHEMSLAFVNDVMHLKELRADENLPVW